MGAKYPHYETFRTTGQVVVAGKERESLVLVQQSADLKKTMEGDRKHKVSSESSTEVPTEVALQTYENPVKMTESEEQNWDRFFKEAKKRLAAGLAPGTMEKYV